ncbi:polysaccharide deacetylase family protein [Pedobacter sp. PWIIR3]
MKYLSYKVAVLVLIQLLIGGSLLNAQNIVSNYQLTIGTADVKGEHCILLRKFDWNSVPTYLATDPNSLITKTVKATDLSHIVSATFPQLCLKMGNTPYIRALLKAQAEALPMQDAGITHAFPKENGITLTIDLCPSHKGLDRNIFTSLITTFKNIEQPVPVALSLTGKFLLAHEGDIAWLKDLATSGQISITWINHTYHHFYDPSRALSRNFLLEPGTNLNEEVLALEVAMLEQGLLPSVFFRFPGLVSNQQLVNKICSYGLIPVGSDAWLAKGQQALNGSLVLIHGNGNEPLGIKDFVQLLKNEAPEVQKKQWLLYDLRNAVANK